MSTSSATPNIETIREWWSRRPAFRHIDLADAQLLYMIPVGWCGFVAVIGHPEHGSYEWIAREEVEFVGDTTVRLRTSRA